MANHTADGVHYGLQDLVMAPAVASLTQDYGATTEDVYHDPSFQAQRASW